MRDDNADTEHSAVLRTIGTRHFRVSSPLPYFVAFACHCSAFDFSRLSGMSDGKKTKIIAENLRKIATNRGNRILAHEELLGHLRAMGVHDDPRGLIDRLNGESHILKIGADKWKVSS